MTYEYQPSSELSALVRKHDKAARDALAKRWREMRKTNPRGARKIFILHRKAMEQAIINFWNTPSGITIGLLGFLKEYPE